MGDVSFETAHGTDVVNSQKSTSCQRKAVFLSWQKRSDHTGLLLVGFPHLPTFSSSSPTDQPTNTTDYKSGPWWRRAVASFMLAKWLVARVMWFEALSRFLLCDKARCCERRECMLSVVKLLSFSYSLPVWWFDSCYNRLAFKFVTYQEAGWVK